MGIIGLVEMTANDRLCASGGMDSRGQSRKGGPRGAPDAWWHEWARLYRGIRSGLRW
jgi:hypothetical protein